MRYYLLRQDALRDHWQAVFADDVAQDELLAGLPIAPPAGSARVTVAPDAETRSDYLELPCPLMSDAMRRALDGAGVDNLQYFPARVVMQYAETEALADYWVANVVGAIACARTRQTDGTPRGASAADDGPEPPFQVDPVRARGFDMFRLAEDRRLLVVSERVAEALRAARLQGVVLQAPEEYNGLPVNSAFPPARGDARRESPRG